jgi:hypothetical protein
MKVIKVTVASLIKALNAVLCVSTLQAALVALSIAAGDGGWSNKK